MGFIHDKKLMSLWAIHLILQLLKKSDVLKLQHCNGLLVNLRVSLYIICYYLNSVFHWLINRCDVYFTNTYLSEIMLNKTWVSVFNWLSSYIYFYLKWNFTSQVKVIVLFIHLLIILNTVILLLYTIIYIIIIYNNIYILFK